MNKPCALFYNKIDGGFLCLKRKWKKMKNQFFFLKKIVNFTAFIMHYSNVIVGYMFIFI